MPEETPRAPVYWFPAKRYGWGWGLPITWQGWVVFAAFLVLLIAGVIFFFPLHKSLRFFIVYVVVLSGALAAICWLKGEPPRWRWGSPKR